MTMTVFVNLSYIELHKVSNSNLKSRVNLISKKAVHLVVNDFQMQICKFPQQPSSEWLIKVC